MRIALNGASGYIGSAFVNHLVNQGHEVCPFIMCVNDVDEYVANFRRWEKANKTFDAFVHLAGIVGDDAFDVNKDKSLWVNVDGLSNVLGAVKRSAVQRFVYVSSGSVYGTCPYDVVNEGVECKPLTEYAKAKLFCESLVKNESHLDGFQYVIVRPGSVCGVSPNMNWKSVVNRMTYDALSKGVITVNGGDQYRAVTSMDYLCHALEVLCILPDAANQVYNVSEDNKTVMALAQLVVCTVSLRMGKHPKVIVNPDAKDDRSYRLNSDKSHCLLQPLGIYQTTLLQPIKEMCDWWKANNDK